MIDRQSIAAIIPARFSSSRFPGKPLVEICGMTMIERVYRQARQCRLTGRVMVATDDARIAEAVAGFGGEVALTSPDHPSGTDRLAEVAARHEDIQVIVNVQGDEPLISPQAVDAAIEPLLNDPRVEMSTLSARIENAAEVESATVVKVVTGADGYALYFSRSPIPVYRDGRPFAERRYLGHVGLYVYRRDCLLRLASLPPTPLEQAESLEQLRALENGIRIKVVETGYRPLAVDVPADVSAVEAALAAAALVPPGAAANTAGA